MSSAKVSIVRFRLDDNCEIEFRTGTKFDIQFRSKNRQADVDLQKRIFSVCKDVFRGEDVFPDFIAYTQDADKFGIAFGEMVRTNRSLANIIKTGTSGKAFSILKKYAEQDAAIKAGVLLKQAPNVGCPIL